MNFSTSTKPSVQVCKISVPRSFTVVVNSSCSLAFSLAWSMTVSTVRPGKILFSTLLASVVAMSMASCLALFSALVNTPFMRSWKMLASKSLPPRPFCTVSRPMFKSSFAASRPIFFANCCSRPVLPSPPTNFSLKAFAIVVFSSSIWPVVSCS